MTFLETLEGLRTPFLDQIFLFFTTFGEEFIFTVVIVGTLWCVDKRAGRWMFFAWISGSALSQFFKALFKVPRPWLKNTGLSVVEDALPNAGGYSFPSGHSQSVAGLFGSAAVFVKKTWARILCGVIILLTVFSRMYLGVHTLSDVAAGAGLGLFTVFLMVLCMRAEDSHPRTFYLACAAIVLLSGMPLLYAAFSPGLSGDETLAEALYNGGKLTGAALGLFLAFHLDLTRVNFDVRAKIWVQPIKFIVGAGGLLALKALKAPLQALVGLFAADGTVSLMMLTAAADGVRYFLIAMFAGIIYPLTFKYWAKI